MKMMNTDRETMKLALEALEINLPIAYAKNGRGERFPCFSDDPLREIKTREAITALRQALDHVPDTMKMTEPDMGIDRGAWDDVPDATKWVDELRGGDETEQEPVTWRNAAIRLGEDLYSVGPNGYYDMTASQWLDWALSVVNTAPPKPAQDLIVGHADSHDIARDGHDFWVSRQPGKNTVPLYLYGHPPKIWQGLTGEDIAEGAKQSWIDKQAFESAVWWAEEKLRDKNGF